MLGRGRARVRPCGEQDKPVTMMKCVTGSLKAIARNRFYLPGDGDWPDARGVMVTARFFPSGVG
jgi:hypothetical protein